MRVFPVRRLIVLLACASTAWAATASLNWPATTRKADVALHAEPNFNAPATTKLPLKTAVTVIGQQGLWYQVEAANHRTGYVRVNDILIAAAKTGDGDDNVQALVSGRSGHGHVTETAGVRGLDESDLRAASFNSAELAKMEAQRATPDAARSWAAAHDWHARSIPWPAEMPEHHGNNGNHGVHKLLEKSRGLLSSLGRHASHAANAADEATAPGTAGDGSDDEELALGPMIMGRLLGAVPLWKNPTAQRRVNVIGRWLVLQSSRPNLPWTFGVIDSPAYNAFTAPGGYIVVTRGLYELVDNDQELAGILAHEITHAVQGDQYNVIRKQQMTSAALDLASSEVTTGGGLAGQLARDYVEKNGAAMLLTSLDRSAEYRADAVGSVYLARAGMDPLALYAILQKMQAVGSKSGALAQLYKTHPSIENRLERLDRLDYGQLDAHDRD